MKPSVQSEAGRGTLVFKAVMWEALPLLLHRLNVITRSSFKEGCVLTLTVCPFKFAIWMCKGMQQTKIE